MKLGAFACLDIFDIAVEDGIQNASLIEFITSSRSAFNAQQPTLMYLHFYTLEHAHDGRTNEKRDSE